jgi:hypothetical protein
MKEKGKILRVKTGYNPNSSSIGSVLPVFFYIAGIAGMLSVFIINMFQKTDNQIKQNKEKPEPVSENTNNK